MATNKEIGTNGIAQIRDLIVGEDMAKVNRQIHDIQKQLDALRKQLDAEHEQTQKSVRELKEGQSESLKSAEQNLLT